MQNSPSDHFNIEYLPPNQVLIGENNPRRHPSQKRQRLKRVIERDGFNVPIMIDKWGNMIAGHLRLEIAKEIGLQSIPVLRLGQLSRTQAKALMLADNRFTEEGEWDWQIVKEILVSLEIEINLETTGFSCPEIDLCLNFDSSAQDEAAEEVIAPATGPAVSAAGDCWHLGRHRVLCGDSLVSESYLRILGDAKAAIVVTDPPYNVKIDGNVGGLGKITPREFAMASGEMTAAEFTLFLSTVCSHLVTHSCNGSIHYIFMDWRHLPELHDAGKQHYSALKNVCVWVKDNGGMGSFYRSQHEFVFVFKNGSAPHQNHFELGQHGRYRTNVWQYAGANSFSRLKGGEDPLAMHPTVKPVQMVADALTDCSRRGEIVLDPFLGSGTTLIAAERTGRICRGIELDPLYVDTAIRRWQRETGLEAIRERDGMSFTVAMEASDVEKD